MISVLQTVYQTNNDSPIIRVGDSCTDVIIFMCYSFSKKFFGYSVRIPAQQACEERDMAIDKVREFFAGTELEGKIIMGNTLPSGTSISTPVTANNATNLVNASNSWN